jgi:bifunctional UDP-N-acetylglucosamine pyrophosphorylase/glucosamine-1-phosphate N-acetyltransferase
MRLCAAVGNENAAGEFYLTDIVALARAEGLSAGLVLCDEAETMGVNTRAQLAQAEAAFQTRARAEAMENGVTLVAPETVFLALDTVIGRDSVVGPNVVFGPGVTIESPRSAPLPACAPVPNWPRMCMSAISWKSRTPSSTKA